MKKILLILVAIVILAGVWLLFTNKSSNDYVEEMKTAIPDAARFVQDNEGMLDRLISMCNYSGDVRATITASPMVLEIYAYSSSMTYSDLKYRGSLEDYDGYTPDTKDVIRTLLVVLGDDGWISTTTEGPIIHFRQSKLGNAVLHLSTKPQGAKNTDDYYTEAINDQWSIEIYYQPLN